MTPDFPAPGIAYIGAVAHRDGHEVKLIDGSLRGHATTIKEVCDFSPDIIGITCWTLGREQVWKLAASLKELLPGTRLVMGGQHPTFLPRHIFIKTHAMAVVLGEGEVTFSELLKTLESMGDLKNVPGLALPDGNGGVFFTAKRVSIDDLDSIPMPYYDGYKDFDFADYEGFPALPKPTAAVISSRGCVFECTYCASVQFWGKRWRFRSHENVLDELEMLVKKHRVKSIFFFDDNFLVRRSRAEAICQGIIDRNLNIKWACVCHVKMIIDIDLLNLMKASGCVSIDFGVESGSDKILRNINKKQTRADIERAFALIRLAGLEARAYLMVGNKGEDKASIDETIEMVKIIKPRHSFSGAALLLLFPGTLTYAEAVANGFVNDDYWLDHDDVSYNLQEHSYEELCRLRERLMYGIAKGQGGILPLISYHLKKTYYRHPRLSVFRSMVPNIFR